MELVWFRGGLKMTINIRWLIVVFALFAGGCTTFETVPFDPSTHAGMDKITIVDPAAPTELDVHVLAPVGANFGLIGALATEAGLSAKRKTLNAAMATQQYDYLKEFNATLDESIGSAGYVVSRGTVERDVDDAAFLEDYSAIATDGAILDIYLQFIGYAAAGSNTEYRPTVMLAARLVDGAGSTLFADQIHYNPLGQTGDAITLDPHPDYAFEKFDMIEAEPARAAEGMSVAIKAVLGELAGLLEK